MASLNLWLHGWNNTNMVVGISYQIVSAVGLRPLAFAPPTGERVKHLATGAFRVPLRAKERARW